MFDENGYVYIVDRIKDMIVTGGGNVCPRGIEEVLYKRPEVGKFSDKKYGERGTACIALKQRDQQLDLVNLKFFLKAGLIPFKVPKEFIVLDELPNGSTGKVLKCDLRRDILNKLKMSWSRL